MRILVCQLFARSLCPHHEGIHRPLYMRFALQFSVPMRGHSNQLPVITLQDARHRVTDADWKALIVLAPTLWHNNSRETHWVRVVFLSRRLGTRSTLEHGGFIVRTPCTASQWLFCHFRGQSTNLSLKKSCVNAHTRRISGNPFVRTLNLPSLPGALAQSGRVWPVWPTLKLSSGHTFLRLSYADAVCKADFLFV